MVFFGFCYAMQFKLRTKITYPLKLELLTDGEVEL
jgi:hypothetical protein